MSAPTRKRLIVWTDVDGNVYTDTRKVQTRGTSLGSIPAARRLVDAHCPGRHLTAILVSNGDDAPPVVMVHNAALGPTPQLMLVEGGLAMAWLSSDDEGTAYLEAIGHPRQGFQVDCPSCGGGGVAYWLEADALNRALTRGRKRIGLGRVGDA